MGTHGSAGAGLSDGAGVSDDRGRDDARPRVGEQAPDVELVDTHGTPVRLSDLRGRPVALVFFPFAFSGICTSELRELRDNLGAFEERGVRLLAISCDPMFALRAWAEAEELTFDLLSDFWPHGAAARAYGVLDEGSGFALRGSFLIDAEGFVVWSVVNPRGRARDLAVYRQALGRLAGAGAPDTESPRVAARAQVGGRSSG